MSTSVTPMFRLARWAIRALLIAGALFFAVLVAWAFESRSMADLRVWHTASLSAEFTAQDATPDTKLANYLAREEQLFAELHEQVYAQVEPSMACFLKLNYLLILWELSGDAAHLEEACAILDHLIAHAPAESRVSLVQNNPIHRAVAAARGTAP